MFNMGRSELATFDLNWTRRGLGMLQLSCFQKSQRELMKFKKAQTEGSQTQSAMQGFEQLGYRQIHLINNIIQSEH